MKEILIKPSKGVVMPTWAQFVRDAGKNWVSFRESFVSGLPANAKAAVLNIMGKMKDYKHP
jgi:hypothetical protein